MTDADPLDQSRSAGRGFRPDVEGLRALAILLVVVYHAWPHLCPGGFVGVDVFFVISGFLITRQLVGDIGRSGRISFSRFYARRARRILPAAAVASVATVVASRYLLAPLAARSVDKDALASAVFGMNYRLAVLRADYLNVSIPVSPLQHYWSLSVEEQFYILWPALLAGGSLLWLGRRSKRGPVVALAVLGGCSLAVSVWLTSRSPTWAYYSLWTRAWELAVGGLVCLALGRLRRLPTPVGAVGGWAGLAAIVAASEVFRDSTPFPGLAALAPVLGAAAVIVAGSADQRPWAAVESILARAPAQGLGRVSYSLYLWHFPVLVLAPVLIGHPLNSAQTGLAVLVSLGLAVTSFRLVEQPIRQMPVLVRRPMRGILGGLGLIGAMVVAVSLATASLPSLKGHGPAARLAARPTGLTLPVLQQQLAAALDRPAVPVNLVPTLDRANSDVPIVYHDGCHVGQGPTTSPPCVFGDPASSTTVVLFGDSHAAEWFPALSLIAAQQHWRLLSLTKSGCPPVEVTVPRPNLSVTYTACPTWRQYALRRIADAHPQLVVVSWDRSLSTRARTQAGTPGGYGSAWLDGVHATLQALRDNAYRVVFIMDTPQFTTAVPTCLSAHLTDALACTAASDSPIDLPGLGRAEALAAANLGVDVVDPTSWFCTRGRCPAIVGNILVYRDADHMVPQYSAYLAPLLKQALLHPASTGPS